MPYVKPARSYGGIKGRVSPFPRRRAPKRACYFLLRRELPTLTVRSQFYTRLADKGSEGRNKGFTILEKNILHKSYLE